MSISSLFAKDKIYLPFFELINVDNEYQYSTSKLLKDYIDETLGFELILPSRITENFNYPTETTIIQSAIEAGCKYYLLASLNRIGDNVIINVNLKDAVSQESKWKDRLKAATPEDLDPIMQNIANAINANSKGNKAQSIYSVSDYNATPLKQVKTNNAFGVSIGGLVYLNNPTKTDLSAGAEGYWLYDARNVIYQISGGLYGLGGTALAMNGSLGVLGPMNDFDNTFFVGASAGLNYISTNTSDKINSYDGGGLYLGANLGYLIGRTSSTTFKVQIEYNIGLYSLEQYTTKVKTDFPQILKFNFGIYFGK